MIINYNGLKIDLWSDNTTPEEIQGATATFYPNSGIYSGNVFNKKGDFIGDYTERNSTKIEKAFPGIFGE